MLDLIASFLVRGINLVFHVMPMKVNLAIGRSLGGWIHLLSGKRNAITYANLKAAYALSKDDNAKNKTPQEIKRITKAVYRNMGQTFTEILSMTKIKTPYINKFINVRNFERIQEAARNPKGMILLSAHFGNWELSTVTSVAKGFPLYLLARDQKMKRLNELLNLLRESKGNIVIRKGADVKNIFRMLQNGKSIGILADQNAGAQGLLDDFFGRPASTAVGPYRFAQKSGAWILPAFIHRVKGQYHELVLEKPMIISREDDIKSYVHKYNMLLEKHVRAHPDQWLWMHKRWKMTPVKYVMVLDDGKKGHLKQSLAVVEQIKIYRAGRGFSPENLKIQVVQVQFKNKNAKAVFNLASLFFSPRCQGCLKCLKRALKKDSYDMISLKYADIIVSCGSSLSAVNRLMKIENYARSFTVLDPGIFVRKKFDLILVPRHDYAGKRFNQDQTIVTELSPNLVTKFPKIEDKGKNCIGVLLGGDNKYFSFTDETARSVTQELKKACEIIDAELYITTSRRTPLVVNEVLKTEFKTYSKIHKFVSGPEDRDPDTVEKILASSRIVVVSGESISMVSEAVASGRQVLVFMPKKKVKTITKYEKFVKNLEEKGYLYQVGVMDISAKINEIIKHAEAKQNIVPDDNKRIYEKMYKLF
ncbi:MAG: ELM1/GtrOC1 family putative glycosyltransferase [Candidatus Omnitrophota bacterium]